MSTPSTPMKKKHTLSALVENKFGVLARVAGMLSGRGFNIETLNVGPTHDPAFSRITATVIADDAALDRCVKALDKLINVITVHDFSREEVDHVARELILCKVKSDKKTRTEIIEVPSPPFSAPRSSTWPTSRSSSSSPATRTRSGPSST